MKLNLRSLQHRSHDYVTTMQLQTTINHQAFRAGIRSEEVCVLLAVDRRSPIAHTAAAPVPVVYLPFSGAGQLASATVYQTISPAKTRKHTSPFCFCRA